MSGTERIRVPRPALVDGWTLLAAGVLASPVLWQFGQGLVSAGEVLARFAMVLAGCTVVTLGVRALWPAIAGVPAARGAPDAGPETNPEPNR